MMRKALFFASCSHCCEQVAFFGRGGKNSPNKSIGHRGKNHEILRSVAGKKLFVDHSQEKNSLISHRKVSQN